MTPADMEALFRSELRRSRLREAAPFVGAWSRSRSIRSRRISRRRRTSSLVAAPVAVAAVRSRRRPSTYDVWAVSNLVELTKARQQVTDGDPAVVFVVTRRVQGTRLGDDVLRAIDEHGLATFSTAIAQRQAYPQTAAAGQTVFDRGGNVKARAEMDALAEEQLESLEERI